MARERRNRPRRSTAEAFYDVFADFPIDEQAAALKIMEQIHRLAKRDAGRKTIANAEVQIEIPASIAHLPEHIDVPKTPNAIETDRLFDAGDTRPALSGGMEDQDS